MVNGAFGYKNAQVAVIPLGSGNDFIRLFGSKEDFLKLENVINGVPVEFDVIKCGNEIAINQCSMGMDAEVCAMQGKIKKLPLVTGEGAYYIGCLYALLKKFRNHFTVQIDDGEKITQDCLFCFAGNSRWYGGGFMAGPKAYPDDGLLDFINISAASISTGISPIFKGARSSLSTATTPRPSMLTARRSMSPILHLK